MSNVYNLLDKELERLHNLLVMLQKQDNDHNRYGGYSSAVTPVWERIIQIQDLILKSYQANDVALQEKIAEYLLLGSSGKNDDGINTSSK